MNINILPYLLIYVWNDWFSLYTFDRNFALRPLQYQKIVMDFQYPCMITPDKNSMKIMNSCNQIISLLNVRSLFWWKKKWIMLVSIGVACMNLNINFKQLIIHSRKIACIFKFSIIRLAFQSDITSQLLCMISEATVASLSGALFL
jgi:hypothetical protein